MIQSYSQATQLFPPKRKFWVGRDYTQVCAELSRKFQAEENVNEGMTFHFKMKHLELSFWGNMESKVKQDQIKNPTKKLSFILGSKWKYF